MTNPSRIPFYVAVLLLIGAGISLAIWRHMELGIPWLAGEQRPVWMVEARIDFDSNNGPVLASLNVPEQPPGFSIISEQAASPGYGFSIVGKNGNRRAEWTKRDVVGPQTLYFKAQFVPSDRDRPDLS
ncbi:MAG: UUP1 family membrane protein, partial [Marinobacter sp.]|nr:UUP1 family membrane protein [Marinobacter sp.]